MLGDPLVMLLAVGAFALLWSVLGLCDVVIAQWRKWWEARTKGQ